MSDSDSFINEVSDAVRRERLFGYMRRYGWIAIVLVLLIVGAAAYVEYRRSVDAAVAQATGDALLDALETQDEAARVAALEALPAAGASAPITALLTASEQQRAGDIAAARATLDALAANGEVEQIYRDLAQIKSLMLGPGDTDPAARAAALEVLSVPGAPYRLLAMEQTALDQIAAGDKAAALVTLGAITEDAEVSAAQKQRVDALVVAIGGEPPVDPTAATGEDAGDAVPAQD